MSLCCARNPLTAEVMSATSVLVWLAWLEVVMRKYVVLVWLLMGCSVDPEALLGGDESGDSVALTVSNRACAVCYRRGCDCSGAGRYLGRVPDRVEYPASAIC